MMGAEMMMHEVQQRGEACSVVRWRSGLASVGTGLCSKFGSSYLSIEYSWIMHILMEGMIHCACISVRIIRGSCGAINKGLIGYKGLIKLNNPLFYHPFWDWCAVG